LRRLPDGARDRTFAGGSIVHLGSLDASRVIAAGLQNRRKLVVLGSGGECIRTCPSPSSILVRFLGGTSASRCQGRRATIVGTRHGEKLVGTPGRDVIVSLAGNDLVLGRGGNDLICGGRGDDRLVGGKGRDVLRGGAGHNRLQQ
jgi:Ca2+-binding RTX toxin-like protein